MQRMPREIARAAAIGALALCTLAGVSAQRMSSHGTYIRTASNRMDRTFVRMAAQGGIAEVRASQLAIRRSHDSAVRRFAQEMVKDHSGANTELKQTAHQQGVPLPANTDARHRRMYARLSRLHGAAFDRAYMAAQVKDHEATVALFRRETKYGKNRDINAFAMKYLPIIQGHTRMAIRLASR